MVQNASISTSLRSNFGLHCRVRAPVSLPKHAGRFGALCQRPFCFWCCATPPNEMRHRQSSSLPFHIFSCYTADLPRFLLFWDLHLIKWESNEWSSVSLPIWCHIQSVPSVPVFIWSQNKRTASCACCQYGTGHHSVMLLMWCTLLCCEYSCFWELL